jgi:hypothetical protein
VIRVLGLLLFVAACDPVWSIGVTVRSPSGAGLTDAILVLTGCPNQNEHDLGTVAELTDAAGEARVGGLGTAYPECAVTIAKPGYVTQQLTFTELCKGNLEDCDRSQHLDIALQPEP